MKPNSPDELLDVANTTPVRAFDFLDQRGNRAKNRHAYVYVKITFIDGIIRYMRRDDMETHFRQYQFRLRLNG